MKILAIETSCDDTSISILDISGKKEIKFNLLANIISSQIKIHSKYGGVYPTLAKREHQKNILPTFKKALDRSGLLKLKIEKKSILKNKYKTLEKILEKEPSLLKRLKKFLEKYQKPKIDYIAVTIGPGLDPSLWVGVNFAKALSFYWNLPLIPVNHIEGHIFANLIKPISSKNQKSKTQIKNEKIEFPVICLIVSGGHTQLILMEDIGKYTIIGETRDDAAGECFDKTARILGLGYPGGPEIASKAEKWITVNKNKTSINLPRPMIYQKNYDFSFSGLKTAVLYNFQRKPLRARKAERYIQEISFEIQQAIIDVLIRKTIKAAKEYKAKSIILGGGVTANKELRKQFKERIKKELPNSKLRLPSSKFSTDNATMIALAAYFNKKKIKNWQKIKARPNLRI